MPDKLDLGDDDLLTIQPIDPDQSDGDHITNPDSEIDAATATARLFGNALRGALTGRICSIFVNGVAEGHLDYFREVGTKEETITLRSMNRGWNKVRITGTSINGTTFAHLFHVTIKIGSKTVMKNLYVSPNCSNNWARFDVTVDIYNP